MYFENIIYLENLKFPVFLHKRGAFAKIFSQHSMFFFEISNSKTIKQKFPFINNYFNRRL